MAEMDPYEYEQWKETIDWKAYIEYAETHGYTWGDIKWLNNMLSRSTSWKQIKAAKIVIDKLDAEQENAEFNDVYNPKKEKTEIKHLSVRVAWHDNKWNGTVCSNPADNIYCNGYSSLLSERLRRRKDTERESMPEYSGQSYTKIYKETGYLPPCFWSINAFGDTSQIIEHDNPAESKLTNIREHLPAHSVFSWPFAVSFNRDFKVISTDGAYPRNLEDVRIPHFQNKLKEKESLVFLYSNYDNPISGEEQEYLVVGVGILKEKASPTRFNGQDEIIENKKKLKYPNNKNFPRINWALRYSLDWPNNCVRIPYHEYLEEADKSKNYEILNNIKVTISEPELIHNFKYVAMDVDDDACIYLLTKIRQKYIQIENEGIVSPGQIKSDLVKIERFLEMVWGKRGYMPGLNSLTRILLPHLSDQIDFRPLFEELLQFEENQVEAFKGVLENPTSNSDCKAYWNVLEELKAYLANNLGISSDDFIRLAMLNLTSFQFNRIIHGKILEKGYTSLSKICQNPYLLYEVYFPLDEVEPNLGDQLDFPIELFKIDIAYFPNTRYLERLSIQKEFENNDKRRIRALIIQHLRNQESFGHCFDEAKNIEFALANYPLFYRMEGKDQLPEDFLYKIKESYEAHFSEQLVIVEEREKKYFYLNELYNAEQSISNSITDLLSKSILEVDFEGIETYLSKSIAKLKNDIEDFEEDLFVEERRNLYKNIFKQRLYVLAGSPGSGKSYELLNVITELKNKGEKCLLLAPTGKAALRLSGDSEFPGIEALTIDKYLHLYKNKESERLKEYQNIIVDEMSMVDLLKFQELLKCFNFNKPSFNRLILVGDPYQLPPIEYGKVFIDIIEFLKNKEEFQNSIIQLESNCRQSMDREIIDFSRIYSNLNISSEDLEEKISIGGEVSTKGGFHVIYWEDETKLIEGITDRLKQFGNKEWSINETLNSLIGLTNEGHLKKENNGGLNIDGFQILSPYRTGNGGSGKLNTFFQQKIRPEKFMEANKLVFKHTDKVIQNKNVYDGKDLALSNGSMGLAYHDKKHFILFPENKFEPLSFYDSKLKQENLELAYCITVHKSQGSGFDNVFVIVPERLTLLSKELLYTALTRSRRTLTVFIQGKPNVSFSKSLFETIRNRSYTDVRKTSLLSLPFWDYSLEPEKGVYVQSRVEYIIYKKLKERRERNDMFNFSYEIKPIIDGSELKMKTDFTIFTPQGKTFYWEHLGMLGNAYYERKWKFKRTKYQEAQIEELLITTDERHGISEDKIEKIIDLIVNDETTTEDKYKTYSNHHYYLR